MCPNTEFFLVCFFPYSDQKKLHIWILFTQCLTTARLRAKLAFSDECNMPRSQSFPETLALSHYIDSTLDHLGPSAAVFGFVSQKRYFADYLNSVIQLKMAAATFPELNFADWH